MQSDTGSQSSTPQANTQGTSNPQNVPKAGYTDPVAFLNAMANDPVPVANPPLPGPTAPQANPTINPQGLSDKVAKELEGPVAPVSQPFPVQKIDEPPASVPLSKPDVTPKFFDEASDDKTPDSKALETEEAKTDTGEEDELEKLTNPGAEHFKRLRASHSELKKTAKQLTEEREELSTKLKKYETGEIVPEVLQQKDEEIARLSRYEKLVDLKGSKEYREKFVAPIEATTTKLKEIFAEYGVPTEELDRVVSKAINTDNRVELNRFLQEHLGNDELGAIETKGLVMKAKELQQAAAEAEKEPAKMLESLQEEAKAVMQVRENSRQQRIVGVAKSSWAESLDEIRNEGQVVELIHRDDDPEFNKNYPDQLLPQAAKEYGKIVTELGKRGLTELDKPLAKALAKMVLLAHSTSVAVQTRNRAMEGIEELTINLTRQHTMMRPPIGGGVARAANGAPMPSKAVTPEQEARGILSSVLAKK